jgi:hypothetical protein
MMTTKLVGVALAFVLAAPAFAQGDFSGIWKTDLASASLSKKPDVFLLKGGMYSCKTCVPTFTIKADGAFHPTPGHPYYDEVSIKVVSPTEIIETDRLKGKTSFTARTTISADGKTSTTEWEDATGANGKLMKGTGVQTRVGTQPAGAHASSGSWVSSNKSSANDAAMTITLKQTPTGLTVVAPTGEHYTATFGGPFVPIEGDVGGTQVAVKKLPDGRIHIDSKQQGKLVAEILLSLSKDGGTLTYTNKNLLRDTTSSFVAKKVG